MKHTETTENEAKNAQNEQNQAPAEEERTPPPQANGEPVAVFTDTTAEGDTRLRNAAVLPTNYERAPLPAPEVVGSGNLIGPSIRKAARKEGWWIAPDGNKYQISNVISVGVPVVHKAQATYLHLTFAGNYSVDVAYDSAEAALAARDAFPD